MGTDRLEVGGRCFCTVAWTGCRQGPSHGTSTPFMWSPPRPRTIGHGPSRAAGPTARVAEPNGPSIQSRRGSDPPPTHGRRRCAAEEAGRGTPTTSGPGRLPVALRPRIAILRTRPFVVGETDDRLRGLYRAYARTSVLLDRLTRPGMRARSALGSGSGIRGAPRLRRWHGESLMLGPRRPSWREPTGRLGLRAPARLSPRKRGVRRPVYPLAEGVVGLHGAVAGCWSLRGRSWWSARGSCTLPLVVAAPG